MRYRTVLAWPPSGSRSAGMDHARPRVAQDVELAVAVVQVQFDRAGGGFGRAAADLGDLELDAVRDVDPDPVLLASRRANDRPPGSLEHAEDGDLRLSPLDV